MINHKNKKMLINDISDNMPRCKKSIKGRSGHSRQCRNESHGKYCWQHGGSKTSRRKSRRKSRSKSRRKSRTKSRKKTKTFQMDGGFHRMFGGAPDPAQVFQLPVTQSPPAPAAKAPAAAKKAPAVQSPIVTAFNNTLRELDTIKTQFCNFDPKSPADYNVFMSYLKKTEQLLAQSIQMYGTIAQQMVKVKREIASISQEHAQLQATSSQLISSNVQNELSQILSALNKKHTDEIKAIQNQFAAQEQAQKEQVSRVKSGLTSLTTRGKDLENQLKSLEGALKGSTLAAEEAAKRQKDITAASKKFMEANTIRQGASTLTANRPIF